MKLFLVSLASMGGKSDDYLFIVTMIILTVALVFAAAWVYMKFRGGKANKTYKKDL